MTDVPSPPMPDDKDWTWVLERPCPDCGFDPSVLTGRDVAPALRATLPRWIAVLDRPDATRRPSPQVWSAAEYACHVGDVCAVFDARTQLTIDQDDPVLANWDQDETAREQPYWQRRPDQIGPALLTAGERAARTYEGIGVDPMATPGPALERVDVHRRHPGAVLPP